MKGNEAIAEAAIRAGCKLYFGYPITPQTEISAYMAKKMPHVGGTFLQAESEISAINMAYGAAGAGKRVLTSSSSPGISLKCETISYIAASDVPCVICNIVRGGPGLGGIQPAQSDYFQATKGGGHGDYKIIVLAPSSVQEAADLTMEAFDLADLYRIPVMIMGDGLLGQMMEAVEFKEYIKRDLPPKDWAACGTMNMRKKNIINSLYLTPDELENLVVERFKRYETIKKREVKVEEYMCNDADIILVAYGIAARIAKSAVNMARNEGIKAGLIRPVTLWPFPEESFLKYDPRCYLTVEMSMGQMVEDVKLAVGGGGKKDVHFYGRCGGVVFESEEIFEKIKEIIQKYQKG
ncbi:MAG: 3-methyl-2-oxobutanoate dehydrogenase subunit VorB [Clostridiaceae bacterium]|nr:3-methyl-2-oxobutanoate dehydrogenase subunit VorB [Clostridiaceae bacterium]